MSGMALSGKYGGLDIPRIGEEESVFVLRAQDELAEPIIEIYRLLATCHGCQQPRRSKKEIEGCRQGQGIKMPDQFSFIMPEPASTIP